MAPRLASSDYGDLEEMFDIYSYGSNALFDVNIAIPQWSKAALEQAYNAGHKRFVFVWSTTSREGPEFFEAECMAARNNLALMERFDEKSRESELELIPWPFA